MMCGIVGMVCKKSFSVRDDLLESLKRLEYRGYDSAGFATAEGRTGKATGFIINLIEKTGDIRTRAGIAHTRWATHGKVTVENTHPHSDNSGTVFAVHNGIIDNHMEFKEELQKEGCVFRTETDSEVIPHFFALCLKRGQSPEKAIEMFMKRAKGTFAVLLLIKGRDEIYALKRDSPLALGIAEDGLVLGSDIFAFSQLTSRAVYFDDDEYAVLRPGGYGFFDCFGDVVEKKVRTFRWDKRQASKESYEHYMIKEIKEQPEAVERLLRSLETTQKPKLKKFAGLIRDSRRVVFLAAGTSYHASLLGTFLLTKLGIKAHAVIASEFENYLLVDSGTLVVPVSQSGETMDVVSVLKDIKIKKAGVASIVNVPYSTVQRHSDVSIEIAAGQEVCVAATKSFTNQLVTMFALARELGLESIDLNVIPERIQATIGRNENHIRRLAKGLKGCRDIYVIGRGASYPIAREIALKLKEIPYIHAEGMMAGELKHGTIALIEEGTPVISLVPNNSHDMISSTREVEARGARTIVISNTDGEIHIPPCNDFEFAVYSALAGHLLSYYIAKEKGLPIDKPRNLAKSVTVK